MSEGPDTDEPPEQSAPDIVASGEENDPANVVDTIAIASVLEGPPHEVSMVGTAPEAEVAIAPEADSEMPLQADSESESGDEYEDEMDGEEHLIDYEDEMVEQVVEALQIPTREAAGVVFGLMSRRRRLAFLQELLTCGRFDDAQQRRLLATIRDEAEAAQAAQAAAAAGPAPSRHTTPAAIAQAAAQAAANRAAVAAAAVAVPAGDAERMRQEALADAEAKIIVAFESIATAERALGGPHPLLQRARELLLATTLPLAAGAAQAQELVHEVLMTCKAEAKKAVKKADRDVRDVVMLRCRGLCDIKDRDGFLALAAQAYQKEPDKEATAQLLLSYHKDPKNQNCGFVSNNQVANRRNGPRPPRKKKKIKAPENEADSAATTSASASQEQGDPSSPCCAAAIASSPAIYQDQQNGKGKGYGEEGWSHGKGHQNNSKGKGKDPFGDRLPATPAGRGPTAFTNPEQDVRVKQGGAAFSKYAAPGTMLPNMKQGAWPYPEQMAIVNPHLRGYSSAAASSSSAEATSSSSAAAASSSSAAAARPAP